MAEEKPMDWGIGEDESEDFSALTRSDTVTLAPARAGVIELTQVLRESDKQKKAEAGPLAEEVKEKESVSDADSREPSQLQALWDMFGDANGANGSFYETEHILVVSPSVAGMSPPEMTDDSKTETQENALSNAAAAAGGDGEAPLEGDGTVAPDGDKDAVEEVVDDADDQAMDFVREVTLVIEAEAREKTEPPAADDMDTTFNREKAKEVSMASAYQAMQQRYMDQVQSGELVTEVKKKTDLQRIPLNMQGNTKFYSEEMMQRRSALRVNKETVWVLAQLWLDLPRKVLPGFHEPADTAAGGAFTEEKKKGEGEEEGASTEIPPMPPRPLGKGLVEKHCRCYSITKTSYTALSAFLWKRLVPQGNYTELATVLEADWQRETQYRGDNKMLFDEFCDSFFVTIDVWCPTMNLNDYTLFTTQIVRPAAKKAAAIDPDEPFNHKTAFAKRRKSAYLAHSHLGTAAQPGYAAGGDPAQRRRSSAAGNLTPKPMHGGGPGGDSFDRRGSETQSPTTGKKTPNMERLEQLATPRANQHGNASAFEGSGRGSFSESPIPSLQNTHSTTDLTTGVVGTGIGGIETSTPPKRGLEALQQSAAEPTAPVGTSSVVGQAARRNSPLAGGIRGTAVASNSPTAGGRGGSPTQGGVTVSTKPHPKSLLSAFKKVITFVYLASPPSAGPVINLEQIRAHHRALVLQAANDGALDPAGAVQTEAEVTAKSVEFLKRSFSTKDTWRPLAISLAETLKTTPLVVTVVNPPPPPSDGSDPAESDFLVDDSEHQCQISPVEVNPKGFNDYDLAVELLVLPIPKFNESKRSKSLAQSSLVLPSPILNTVDHSDSQSFRSYISLVHNLDGMEHETQYPPRLASHYYQHEAGPQQAGRQAALGAVPGMLPVYMLSQFVATLADLLGKGGDNDAEQQPVESSRPATQGNQHNNTGATQHHPVGVMASRSYPQGGTSHHLDGPTNIKDPSPEGDVMALRQQQKHHQQHYPQQQPQQQQQQQPVHQPHPPPQGVMVARSQTDDLLMVLPEPTQIVSHKAAIGRKLTKHSQVTVPEMDSTADQHQKPRAPSIHVKFPHSTKPSALVSAQNEMRKQGRNATEVLNPAGDTLTGHMSHYIDSISARSGHGQMTRRYVAVVDGGGAIKKEMLLQEAMVTHPRQPGTASGGGMEDGHPASHHGHPKTPQGVLSPGGRPRTRDRPDLAGSEGLGRMERRPMMPPSEAAQLSIQVFEAYDRPFLVNRAKKAAQFTRLPKSSGESRKRFNPADLSHTKVSLRKAEQQAKAMSCKSDLESVIRDNTRLGNGSKSRATLEIAVLSENNQRKNQEMRIAKGQVAQESLSPLSKKEEDLLVWAEKKKQQRLPDMTVDTRAGPRTPTSADPTVTHTHQQKAETARIRAVNHEQLGHLRPSREKQLDDLTADEHPQHGANLAMTLYGVSGAPQSPTGSPTHGSSPKFGTGRSTTSPPRVGDGVSLPPLGGTHKPAGGTSLPESAPPSFATRGPFLLLSKRTLQDQSGTEHSVWEVAKRKHQERERQKAANQRENFMSSYAKLQQELLALPIGSSTKRKGPTQNYEPTEEQKSGFQVPFSRVPHTGR